jgi:tripartite-type tricarboxylate transporter receptor subunit TctC
LAEDAYPSRPIHVIVGFTPGASADVAARVLAATAGPMLGQQVVVENKPGAGSSIAAEYVGHAAKDGYTLFLATLSIIINQITNRNPSFDLVRDLTPVALLESGAVILVVNPDSGPRNVAELIALAKSKPGEVLSATVIGSLPHFATEFRPARRHQADPGALPGKPTDGDGRDRRPRLDDLRAGFVGYRPDRRR